MTELQQKKQDSERIYRLISENIIDLIEIINKDFKIEYFNKEAHSNLLNYSKEDLIGKNISDLIFSKDRDKTIDSFK